MQAIGKKLIIEIGIKKKSMESVMGKIKLWLGRSVIYICAFTVPFLMVQLFFAICRVYPYGPFSILTGDMDLEFVNFYSYYLKDYPD